MNESVSLNRAYPETLTSFKEDFHWLIDRGFIPVDPDMSKWRNVQVLAVAPDENASMATTVKMVSEKNPDWESLPKDKEQYEHCILFDKHVLFVDGRFSRENLPKGLYAYDLRGSDDDPGEPATLERAVMVNHVGTVISAEPLFEEDTDYRELGEGLDFQDDAMTLRDFIEMYSLEWEHSLWKWQAFRNTMDGDCSFSVQGQLASSPAEAIESMLKAVDEKTRKEVTKE